MSNLYKAQWVTVNNEKARIIDNNDLADKKIQVFREEVVEEPPESEKKDEGEEADFAAGIDPEQLEQLTEDRPEHSSSGGVTLSDQKQKEIAAQIEEQMNEAKQKADSLVREAQEKAEAITEEAKKSGYDEGFSQGTEDAHNQVQNDIDEKEKQIEEDYDRKLAELEPKMVDTLTKVYEHVFDVGFGDDKKIILHLLKTALSRIQPGTDFRIHVSANDYDTVCDAKEQIQEVINIPDASFDIIDDSVLKENECIIETDGGIFDCSIGTELKELKRKLKLLAFDRRKS